MREVSTNNNIAESIYNRIQNGVLHDNEVAKYKRPSSSSRLLNTILEKLSNLDQLSDQELYDVVSKNFSKIIEKIVSEKDILLINKFFRDKRFLLILKQSLSNNNFSDGDRLRINNLIYDYNTQNEFKTDDDIVSILDEISSIINYSILPKILGLGIPKYIALKIVNASKSSFNDIICVRRVDLILYNTSDMKMMNEQTIIDIFTTLFGDRFLKLFEGVLFDSYSDEELQQATEDSREIYYTINLAIFDIINTLPSYDIEKILMCYNELMSVNYKNKEPRLRFILSDDFYRINDVIEYLKTKGIYI